MSNDLNTFRRYTLGFEDLFNNLNSLTLLNHDNFPPFNISVDGNVTVVEIAVAGYSKDDIKVSVEGSKLSIIGENLVDTKSTYTHRGIAKRAFSRTFSLHEHAVVEDVSLVDGLLKIKLVTNIPEKAKPKLLTIN